MLAAKKYYYSYGVLVARFGLIMARGLRVETVVTVALMIVLSSVLLSATNRLSSRRPEATSDYYKAQCVSCHGDQADLKFDQKTPDEELVRIVLKGKLVDVPPDMPACRLALEW